MSTRRTVHSWILTIFVCIGHLCGMLISNRDIFNIIILTTKVSKLATRAESIGFRWTHKLHMFKKQLPEKANWVEDGYYFVVQPCTMRHIGHFAEAINHLLIKLRYPSFYPPFTDMYIPMFVNELEWSETYMKLLLSLFPENLKPAVHLGYSISTSPIACFRSAVAILIE